MIRKKKIVQSALSPVLLVGAAIPLLCAAGVEELPEVEVIARRYFDPNLGNPLSTERIDRSMIERAPQRRMDDILRNVPGFSLFRRSGSRVAHPTTQGVSLRNLGPNGAGRTLVLLDGIPLNDPFGGWVYWNRFSPANIEAVEVVKGGGSGPWGNAALGGVISIFSRRSEADFIRVETSGGSRASYDGTLSLQHSAAGGKVFLRANKFSTDGYPVLKEEQRGPIDRNAFSDSETVEGGFRMDFGEGGTLAFRASYFHENRGNGTPLSGNHTNAYNMSLSYEKKGGEGGADWRTQFYYQKRDFSNRFTSVNAARDSERPVLDQFDVPAESLGGSLLFSTLYRSRHHLTGGMDARYVKGETNERFFFSDASFLRERSAGGEQFLWGLFLEDQWKATSKLQFLLGGRLDYWRIEKGMRRQRDRTTGSILRDEEFPDREEWVGNFRVGFNYRPIPNLKANGLLYSGFRAPTLNELYRPFRVRSDITEANPELAKERLLGGEIGFEWQPREAVALSLTYFLNRLEDAVANVTLAPGPGRIDPCGFVPEGGSCRQRRNLGRARISGLELGFSWQVDPHLLFRAGYLYSETLIQESPDSIALEGNRLAQTPEHQLSAALEWNGKKKWRHTLQLRYTGRQFEDDLNSLRLGAFLVVDLSTRYAFSKNLDGFITVENLFDTEFETGKSTSGLVATGAPFLFSAGLRWKR